MTALVKLQSNVKRATVSNTAQPKRTFEKKEWELVPEGDYVGQLIKWEEKVSKAGNTYIQVRFELDVEGVTRSVFTKFIIEHANPNVKRAALAKLQAMVRCLGGREIEDTSELEDLIGKQCILHVVCMEGQGGFKDYNEVKKFIRM
jgi:hypothetical protein